MSESNVNLKKLKFYAIRRRVSKYYVQLGLSVGMALMAAQAKLSVIDSHLSPFEQYMANTQKVIQPFVEVIANSFINIFSLGLL